MHIRMHMPTQHYHGIVTMNYDMYQVRLWLLLLLPVLYGGFRSLPLYIIKQVYRFIKEN